MIDRLIIANRSITVNIKWSVAMLHDALA